MPPTYTSVLDALCYCPPASGAYPVDRTTPLRESLGWEGTKMELPRRCWPDRERKVWFSWGERRLSCCI